MFLFITSSPPWSMSSLIFTLLVVLYLPRSEWLEIHLEDFFIEHYVSFDTENMKVALVSCWFLQELEQKDSNITYRNLVPIWKQSCSLDNFLALKDANRGDNVDNSIRIWEAFTKSITSYSSIADCRQKRKLFDENVFW